MYAQNSAVVGGNHSSGAKINESLPSIIGEIGSDADRLGKLASLLSHLADRLTGSRPTEVGHPGATETPSISIMDELQRKHRTFMQLLSTCENEAQRIASAVGG